MNSNSLLPAWLKFLDFRAEDHLPIAEKIRRYITFGLSVSMAIGGLFFTVYNSIIGSDFLVPQNRLLFMGGVFGVVLTLIQMYRVSFAVISASAMVSFFVSSVLFDNGAENFLVTGIVATMFMFDNRLTRWSISVAEGAFFIYAKYLLYESCGMSNSGVSFLHHATNLILFLLGLVAFLEVFRVVNRNYRQLLEEQHGQLEKQHRQLEEQATQMAEANDSKERLFAILGHDLRGPVGNVRSVLDLLRAGELTQKESEGFLEELGQEVGNLEGLLENLLGWASTQLQRIEPYPVDYSIRNQVAEVFRIQTEAAGRKKIQLVNDADEKHWVRADQAQIQTALRNLVSNGIKFTPGGGEVRIHTELRGGKVLIVVSDSGVGISEESIRAMRRGQIQKPRRGTHQEKGFGIGLRICDEFISANGDRLSISAEEGKGSVFYFSLPLGHLTE